MKKIYFSIFLFSLLACQSQNSEKKLYHLPSSTTEGIQAVIEIPAGTNEKIEYNTERKRFEVDSINGLARTVNFLPYPGNYGFVPSTYMNPEEGGDGDALDVLVISNSVPTSTVMNVLPIAALKLRDNGEIDTKIIAIPSDSTARTLQSTNFTEFLIEYNMAKKIIEDWFIGYKGVGQIELIGWEDEKGAMREIERWTIDE